MQSSYSVFVLVAVFSLWWKRTSSAADVAGKSPLWTVAHCCMQNFLFYTKFNIVF